MDTVTAVTAVTGRNGYASLHPSHRRNSVTGLKPPLRYVTRYGARMRGRGLSCADIGTTGIGTGDGGPHSPRKSPQGYTAFDATVGRFSSDLQGTSLTVTYFAKEYSGLQTMCQPCANRGGRP